jgi:hypothetical protein
MVKGGKHPSTPVTDTVIATGRFIGDAGRELGRRGKNLYYDLADTFTPRKTTSKGIQEDEELKKRDPHYHQTLEIKSGLDTGNYKNILQKYYHRDTGDYGFVDDNELDLIMTGKLPTKIVLVKKDDKTPRKPVVDKQFIYDLPDRLFELKPNSDGQYKIKHYGVFGVGSEHYTLDEIREKFHIFEKQTPRGGKTKIRRNKKSRKYTKRNRK